MRHLVTVAACLALAACGGGESGNDQASASGNGVATGAERSGGGEAVGKPSLLDGLNDSSDFATLANAVKAAGLERTLSGAQPYTLFAPTEAAFQKLPAGAAQGLLAPEQKGKLTALLTGHIVPGTVTAEDLNRAVERGNGKAQLATVGGTNLTIVKAGNSLVLTDSAGGQARVVSPGQPASNGVLYGIDAMLMPQ